MITSTAAKHTLGQGSQPDAVFSVVQKVREAKKHPGAEKIIDGSIGALKGEDESFSTIPTFEKIYREADSAALFDYATITGSKEFQQAAIDYAFLGNFPKGMIIRCVGTPGGAGAVKLMMSNYLENEDAVLIPDWCWGAYKTIAKDNQRKVETYLLFDDQLNFNQKSIQEKSEELLKKQNQILAIFNTPGHNPTGYSISYEDWKILIDFYKALAEKYPNKMITIGLDMAYVDYSGDPTEARSFLKLFTDLPENIQPLIGFSMSKSFCAYGLRSGALIGFHSSEEVMNTFVQVNQFSARGNWSNGAHGAQETLAKIMSDEKLLKQIGEERTALAKNLKDRAEIFTKEADQVGLTYLPYFGGFFVTIPCEDPKKTVSLLEEKKIFLVPLGKGVRLAVCAIPKGKMPGIAKAIKEAMN